MEKRTLGRSGLHVSQLCFGGNIFGWTVDEATSFKLLDNLADLGFNFIDSADTYSIWVPGNQGGESETIIGKWLKARGNRDRMIIATKGGSAMAPDRKGLSKAYLRTAVEASLRRLQTDYIDLYQSHRDDPDTPIEETLEAYAELIEAGKIRVIGCSNFTAERLGESLEISAKQGLPRYETVQPLYNLYDREGFEGSLGSICKQEQLGVLPYYSLASGFLTGKYRSEADYAQSARAAAIARYVNPRGLAILQVLDEVAARYAASLAQVALAWLIASPAAVVPVASATSKDQLDQLAKATLLKLDAAAIEQLNAASA